MREGKREAGRLRLLGGVWRQVEPPRGWRVAVVLLAGVGAGLGTMTLKISNATSYLSDDPRACVNCHIMQPQYATWERGSHGRVASCNDCHVPHDNIFNKYYFKAKDGTRHAFMFSFHLEPQVIQVHEAGQRVIQDNCIRCHSGLLTLGTEHAAVTWAEALHGAGKLCWECHRETPHGRVNSLSAVPFARVPMLEAPLPEWMVEQFTKGKEDETGN